jgi:large subunit ribosomal protein L22
MSNTGIETVKKTKRSVVKRAKIKAVKEAAKKGPAVAYVKNVPTSPRKMRLVADLIRGEEAFKALTILKFEAKNGSAVLEKLLASAMANWKQKNPDIDFDKANLFVKEIFVDGGRMLKRLRPAPQGRAHRVRKRSNHVTLVVDRKPVPVNVEKKSPVKETKE